MEEYLKPTRLLDYGHPSLARLVGERKWNALPAPEAVGAVYAFVKDEIAFGYNRSDDLPASRVLADGYGQCNTKATLLMALLRAAGIPCRLHGATIHKELQKGAIPPFLFRLAPEEILHTWAEVFLEGRWLDLEGVILDGRYLGSLRRSLGPHPGPYLGHGVAVESLDRAEVEWRGRSTYIQSAGIARDYGIFPDPDAFYAARGANLSGPKAWLYKGLFRHLMNRRVARIRLRGLPVPACRPGC